MTWRVTDARGLTRLGALGAASVHTPASVSEFIAHLARYAAL
jgi:hypothetical protein